MPSQKRLASFDNLRALMMWLGIVLHAADLHVVGPGVTPWRDAQRTVAADLITAVIHTFRIPVFFIVAGFFVSLLVERRGVAGMLENRVRRIGVPFLVGWPIIFAVSVWLTTLYSQKRGIPVAGVFDLNTMPIVGDGSRFQTLHLWFLQILIVLVVLAAAGYSVPGTRAVRVRARLAGMLEWVATQWWTVAPVALLLAFGSRHQDLGIMRASALLVPTAAEWGFNGAFFGFGLLLYGARSRLLPRFEALRFHLLLVGVAALLVAFASFVLVANGTFTATHTWLLVGLPYNASSWLLSCAILGLFSRHFTTQGPVLRYLTESSYWVYLVHMPIIAAVEYPMLDQPIPAMLKMVLAIVATTAVSLLSYQLLVRGTALGRFLGEPVRTTRAATRLAPSGGDAGLAGD